MKKIVLLLLLCSFIKINGQELKIGFGGGLNFSQVHPAPNNYSDFGVGYNFGIEVGYLLSDKISIRSGLKYINKDNNLLKMNYLGIPLTFQYMALKKLGIDVGGEFDYLVYASLGENVNDTKYFKNDINLLAGVSYYISPKFKVSLKYMHGLYKITNDLSFDIYERAYEFMIYYIIK